MPVFVPADPSVYATLKAVLERHARYAPLLHCDLRIEILKAYDPRGGRPLKVAGSPVAAKIKVVGPEERSRGGPDVRILIDLDRYRGFHEKRRHALLAHELYHLQLVDKDGKLVRDDYGRPTVRLIPDDYMINGFVEVYNWYGESSVERMTFQGVAELLSQTYLPLGDPEPVPEGQELPVPAPVPVSERDREIAEAVAEAEAEAPQVPAERIPAGNIEPPAGNIEPAESVCCEGCGLDLLGPEAAEPAGDDAANDPAPDPAPLKRLKRLSGPIRRYLAEAGIRTLGDLDAYMSSGKALTEIPRMTPSKAALVLTEFRTYRADRQQLRAAYEAGDQYEELFADSQAAHSQEAVA